MAVVEGRLAKPGGLDQIRICGSTYPPTVTLFDTFDFRFDFRR